jgi:stearoyl-CoA desaturase (delta-9 desaturase)
VLLDLLIAVCVGLAVSQLANLMTSVYLHRTLSHRAVSMRFGLAFAFRLLCWLTVGIKPREWVAVHRKHHAFTDEDGDPHSPALLGWMRVQFTNPALYRRAAREEGIVDKYARDIKVDRWDRVLFDRPLVGLSLGVGVLWVLLGPWYGIVAAFVHANTYLSISGAVNAIGHRFGRRPYANSATNLFWLALLSSGEGWHNNHHAAPTSARLGFRFRQVDFGWWTIWWCEKFKLLTVRHRRPVFTAAAVPAGAR